MLEATSSLQYTIDRLATTIREYVQIQSMSEPTTRHYPLSYHTIKYHETMVHNTQTRLTSLDKRISSLIQLTYNLVTQHDSRVIQVDSKLMMLIALVTVLFLPANTVAGVFGSGFFSVTGGPDSSSASAGSSDTTGFEQLHVLKHFGLFWEIVLPLTLLLLLGGWLYWKGVRREVLKRPKHWESCCGG
jgi:hypothetical protein